MRQRITYIHEPQDALDPKILAVNSKSLTAPEQFKAAREHRITFGISQLPQELYTALKACHEIHLKWSSQIPYPTISPFNSRVSPGLHIFYTPQPKSKNSDLVCPMLRKVFGDIDCESPEKTFTTLPNDRFSLSTSHQYYSPLDSLRDFTLYVQHKLCAPNETACHEKVSLLLSTDQVDMDFDTISHALTITAFWSSRTWSLDIFRSHPQSRLEVGLLSNEKPIEKEELSLGGFLVVVGEDTKPAPALFSFPARHHPDPSSSTFTSSFLGPTGLHPALQLQISDSKPPFDEDERECKLHTYLTLPKSIFADKYQLSTDNSLFLSSKNLTALRYISEPTDLEAPVYAVETWGSSLLLELAPPSTPNAKSKAWTAEIPLHLRYLPPSNTSATTPIEIPYPVVFWACTAEEGSKFTVNPFDRVSLGYEGLFGGRSMFFHLSPAGTGESAELVNRIEVPVLELRYGGIVEYGTALVVVMGFAWVVWCLWKVVVSNLRGASGGSGNVVVEEPKKDQ